jgi:hypothetical protein
MRYENVALSLVLPLETESVTLDEVQVVECSWSTRGMTSCCMSIYEQKYRSQFDRPVRNSGIRDILIGLRLDYYFFAIFTSFRYPSTLKCCIWWPNGMTCHWLCESEGEGEGESKCEVGRRRPRSEEDDDKWSGKRKKRVSRALYKDAYKVSCVFHHSSAR